MYYSISKQEKFKTKGAIPLSDSICEECLIYGYDFTFKIQAIERTYFLIASTQAEMNDWIKTINQCISSLRKTSLDDNNTIGEEGELS